MLEEDDDDDDDTFWVPEGVVADQHHVSVATHSAGGEPVGRRGAASVGGLHGGSVGFNNPETTASRPCGMVMTGEASSTRRPAHMTTRPACSVSASQQAPAIKGPRQGLSLPVYSLFSTGDDFDDVF